MKGKALSHITREHGGQHAEERRQGGALGCGRHHWAAGADPGTPWKPPVQAPLSVTGEVAMPPRPRGPPLWPPARSPNPGRGGPRSARAACAASAGGPPTSVRPALLWRGLIGGGLRCMHADAKGAPGLPGGDAPHPNVQREVGMHVAIPTGTPDRSYSGCPGQHHPLAHRSPEGRWGGRTPAPEGLPLDRAGLCGLAPAMPLLRGACILYLLWRWRIGAGGTQRSPGESARPLRGV